MPAPSLDEIVSTSLKAMRERGIQKRQEMLRRWPKTEDIVRHAMTAREERTQIPCSDDDVALITDRAEQWFLKGEPMLDALERSIAYFEQYEELWALEAAIREGEPA